jgi:hypothetical protein
MIEPSQSDIGRKVIYRDLSGKKIDEGEITSFTDAYVFVRYGTGSTSAATRRDDLEWSHRLPTETAVAMTTRNGKVTAMDFVSPPVSPFDPVVDVPSAPTLDKTS